MKSLARTMVFIVAFTCMGVAYAEKGAPAATVTKWEYKVVSKSEIFAAHSKAVKAKGKDAENTFEKVLNELGAQGWELVSANDGTLIFKRPKPTPSIID